MPTTIPLRIHAAAWVTFLILIVLLRLTTGQQKNSAGLTLAVRDISSWSVTGHKVEVVESGTRLTMLFPTEDEALEVIRQIRSAKAWGDLTLVVRPQDYMPGDHR